MFGTPEPRQKFKGWAFDNKRKRGNGIGPSMAGAHTKGMTVAKQQTRSLFSFMREIISLTGEAFQRQISGENRVVACIRYGKTRQCYLREGYNPQAGC